MPNMKMENSVIMGPFLIKIKNQKIDQYATENQ